MLYLSSPSLLRFLCVIMKCIAFMGSQFYRTRKLTQLTTKFDADRIRENFARTCFGWSGLLQGSTNGYFC